MNKQFLLCGEYKDEEEYSIEELIDAGFKKNDIESLKIDNELFDSTEQYWVLRIK